MFYHFTLNELEALPTLSQGHTDNLKYEDLDVGVRVWLSRCGVEDGEPYPNKVTVERLVDGRWEAVEQYEAKPANVRAGDE